MYVGAFAGSLSYSKFFVRGDVPEDYQNGFMRRIRHRAFQPLTPEDDADEHLGWSVIGSPLDLVLGYENVYYRQYVCLGMRVDRWRIPGPLLKAHFAQAQQELLEKKGKERLAQTEKQQLRALVTAKLKRQLLPAMAATDSVWNIDTGVVLLWSHSKAVQERFSALFEATYGVELAANSPFVAATEPGLLDEQEAALAMSQASSFHGLPTEAK